VFRIQGFFEEILIKLWKVKAFEKVTTVGFFTQITITTEIREVDLAIDKQNS
jgi:hypothetical protein